MKVSQVPSDGSCNPQQWFGALSQGIADEILTLLRSGFHLQGPLHTDPMGFVAPSLCMARQEGSVLEQAGGQCCSHCHRAGLCVLEFGWCCTGQFPVWSWSLMNPGWSPSLWRGKHFKIKIKNPYWRWTQSKTFLLSQWLSENSSYRNHLWIEIKAMESP